MTNQLNYFKYFKHSEFKLHTGEFYNVTIFNQSQAIHLVQKYIFLTFYFFSWRERESRGRAGREGNRIPSKFHVVSTEPDVGLDPTNPEITTWVKIKSSMLNWLSHLGTPRNIFFGKVHLILWRKSIKNHTGLKKHTHTL